ICWPETLQRSEAAHRTPPGSFALCESEATATNVLSARKRSVSDKAPSRNGNQPYATSPFFSQIAHFYRFVFPQKVLNEDKKFGYSNVRKEVHY
ncbi:hypothetical protein, partial [Lysinibacillus sp. NPDC059133]|uniref:hypothetical protein n=1 Tax=Lysinibacillus sp. NPDC059133 TaxID=3346737 RepID=UPI0036C6C818